MNHLPTFHWLPVEMGYNELYRSSLIFVELNSYTANYPHSKHEAVPNDTHVRTSTQCNSVMHGWGPLPFCNSNWPQQTRCSLGSSRILRTRVAGKKKACMQYGLSVSLDNLQKHVLLSLRLTLTMIRFCLVSMNLHFTYNSLVSGHSNQFIHCNLYV